MGWLVAERAEKDEREMLLDGRFVEASTLQMRRFVEYLVEIICYLKY